jgi:hypothetical protein
MEDPITVALERRAEAARVLLPQATLRLVRPDRERREPTLLVLAHPRFERIRDSSRNLLHEDQAR